MWKCNNNSLKYAALILCLQDKVAEKVVRNGGQLCKMHATIYECVTGFQPHNNVQPIIMCSFGPKVT